MRTPSHHCFFFIYRNCITHFAICQVNFLTSLNGTQKYTCPASYGSASNRILRTGDIAVQICFDFTISSYFSSEKIKQTASSFSTLIMQPAYWCSVSKTIGQIPQLSIVFCRTTFFHSAFPDASTSEEFNHQPQISRL